MSTTYRIIARLHGEDLFTTESSNDLEKVVAAANLLTSFLPSDVKLHVEETAVTDQASAATFISRHT